MNAQNDVIFYRGIVGTNKNWRSEKQLHDFSRLAGWTEGHTIFFCPILIQTLIVEWRNPTSSFVYQSDDQNYLSKSVGIFIAHYCFSVQSLMSLFRRSVKDRVIHRRVFLRTKNNTLFYLVVVK